jgi:hypothetical protein
LVLLGTFIFLFSDHLIKEDYLQKKINVYYWGYIGKCFFYLPLAGRHVWFCACKELHQARRHWASSWRDAETPTVLHLDEVCIHGFEIVQKLLAATTLV